MDEGDDEYVDPNLYSAFGVDSVLNVPASPASALKRTVEQGTRVRRGTTAITSKTSVTF